MKATSNSFAIQVEDLWESFRIYHERSYTLKEKLVRLARSSYEEFWALKNVSFKVKQGETIGIIGENGSGKSTLLKCVARILVPTKGRIVHNGRLSALLELGAGFHPDLTGRENIFLNGAILGLSRKQVRERFDDIVGFAELEQFIDTPVRNYSSGMYVRLGFALAVHSDPDILLIDEVLAVGDEAFQRKCIGKIHSFKKSGVTIVYVSHALASVERMCDRAMLLEHGEVRSEGAPRSVIRDYYHSIGMELPDIELVEAPPGRRRFEEDSDAIRYEGVWTEWEHLFASGGSLMYSNVPGSYATFDFEGSNVAWIESVQHNRGIAKVFFDGEYECDIDLYSSEPEWRKEVFSKTNLEYGKHSIKIEVTGKKNEASKESYVAIDAFDVW